MTNIYQKQMNKLNLNAKQYAELTGMPYEVVKDILYNKEGDYSMEIKNLLRKNMMNKHQEIENDYENAKFKAMELKKEVNYLKWYDKEYSVDLLKEKLQLSNIKQFENNYCLKVNNKKASPWTYNVLVAKREYKRHGIEKGKKLEFIKQLYDIIVNDNADAYYNPITKKVINITPIKQNGKINYKKWYKNFDMKQWKKENNIDNYKLVDVLGLSQGTVSGLVSKKQYSQATLEKFYNYVMSLDTKEETILSNDLTNDELETLDTIDALQDNLTSDKVDISTHQIEIEHDKNAILRMILVNRLTDEEKALIELFGGKIC